MGDEAKCAAEYQGREATGTALLETQEVVFRGSLRFKIRFSDIRAVKVRDGRLELETNDGTASFAIGGAAERWAEKIRHPKSRLEKLGIKAGTTVALAGEFEAEFRSEIGNAGAKVGAESGSELVFVAAESASALRRLSALRRKLAPKAALWVVYPKGRQQIRELDVLQAGRAAGLVDSKVVAFSATHTALRFAQPKTQRSR